MKDNRQEDNALRHFKRVSREMVALFRLATGAPTVSLHWVNRHRRQFVLEAADSAVAQTSFPDRVPMSDSYLRGFEMLTRPAVLAVGTDVPPEALTHYPAGCPIRNVTVVPLAYNHETVALAVVEGDDPEVLRHRSDAIQAFSTAMAHLIHTFLELIELASDEDQWAAYEELIRRWPARSDECEVLDLIMDQVAAMVPGGSVSILARVFDRWCVVMNHELATAAPALGTVMEDQSLAYQALQSGSPEFATHVGASPKRMARTEPLSKGASLAIPFLLHDRRQAVVLVTVENLHFFKESNRHKLVNLVRLGALRLTAGTAKFLAGQDMLAHDNAGLIPDMIDRAMLREFKRGGASVGLVTVHEVSSLRSRMRMEETKSLQRLLNATLNPVRYGYAGLCGPHADFVTLVLLTGGEEDRTRYLAAIREGVSRIQGHSLTVAHAFQAVDAATADPYDVKRALRLALDAAVKSKG